MYEKSWTFKCLKLLIFILTMQEKSSSQTLEANLRIDRTEKATPSEPVFFSCILSSSLPKMTTDLCLWITPQGKTFIGNSSSGEVKENNTLIPGLSATAANNTRRNCSLYINATKAEDFGRWSCKMEGTPWHMGTFYLLNKMESPGYVTDVRLPRHIVPNIYDITLVPILEVGNFTTLGVVEIHFNVNSSNTNPNNARKIYIHHKDILINEQTIKVTNTLEQLVIIVGHEYDLERDFYIAHLEMEALNGTILMNFISILNDQLTGFYRSSYHDERINITKYLAVTHFEPHHAREAFPCMDEPDMKAIFNVKLGHKNTMTARSNMDIIDSYTEPILGYQIDIFHSSVRMSTYTVAFLVSEFAPTSNLVNNSFKIWCNPAKANSAKYAADVGLKILKYFENYTDIPYPLPKMDMAAIPHFKYGAMENWGLVTYKEQHLLYDEESKIPELKENVAYVIVHELVHQWFGNLVTMSWWTDLWLNEGFASYGESIGMEHILPEHKFDDRALLDSLHSVFSYDAKESAMATSYPVLNPDYDPGGNINIGYLVYDRGECLIRMMEAFLTKSTFWNGVKRYLMKLQYQNAERRDLWNALDQVAIEDNITLPYKMDEIMESWTLQPGFPLVTVTRLNDTIYLEQKRFIFEPEKLQHNSSYENARWHIPVSVEYPGGNFEDTMADVWIHPNQLKTEFKVQQGAPYIINVKSRSLYRVNYDPQNWNSLAVTLTMNHSSIHMHSRTRIIDDSQVMARTGHVNYSMALNITKYLVKEREFVPLQAMMNQLEYLSRMLDGTEIYSRWKKHVVKLLKGSFDDLTENNTNLVNLLTQRLLTEWTCLYGHQNCIERVNNKFREWMNATDPDSNNPIYISLREYIYKAVVRAATGQEEIIFLLQRLPKAKYNAANIIKGLGSTNDKDTIIKFLDMTVDNSSLLKSHRDFLYQAVGATAMGRRLQFDWLRDNYEKLKNLDIFKTMVDTITNIMLNSINNGSELNEVEAFKNKTAEMGLSAAWKKEKKENILDKKSRLQHKMEVRYMRREKEENIILSPEEMRMKALANIKWMENYYETIAAWLRDEYEDTGSTTVTTATIPITSVTITPEAESECPCSGAVKIVAPGIHVMLHIISIFLLILM